MMIAARIAGSREFDDEGSVAVAVGFLSWLGST